MLKNYQKVIVNFSVFLYNNSIMIKCLSKKGIKQLFCLKNCSQQYCIMQALHQAQKGKVEDGVVFAGKNVHLIHDILPVQEIMDRMFRECRMQWA